MKTYIALLRGINVSGHKKVLMANLRDLLEKSGLENVKTYIQSGNVIFSSLEKKEVVSKLIFEGILKHYGCEVPVLVLTSTEIKSILNNCPFSEDKKEKSYFILLKSNPTTETVLETSKLSSPKEEFVITNSCIYYLLRFRSRKI
ncbi:MAG: DUF1697 domain-containing protein [Flavobacteriaceae bacterium]|nr:DUF1697 domain-containing protein [Flavobacteriaceae bacterium]